MYQKFEQKVFDFGDKFSRNVTETSQSMEQQVLGSGFIPFIQLKIINSWQTIEKCETGETTPVFHERGETKHELRSRGQLAATSRRKGEFELPPKETLAGAPFAFNKIAKTIANSCIARENFANWIITEQTRLPQGHLANNRQNNHPKSAVKKARVEVRRAPVTRTTRTKRNNRPRARKKRGEP